MSWLGLLFGYGYELRLFRPLFFDFIISNLVIIRSRGYATTCPKVSMRVVAGLRTRLRMDASYQMGSMMMRITTSRTEGEGLVEDRILLELTQVEVS